MFQQLQLVKLVKYYGETYFHFIKDNQAAIDWFKINETIVNPDKFQAIAVKRNCRMKDCYALNISNETINSENCAKLLGIEIDNTLF